MRPSCGQPISGCPAEVRGVRQAVTQARRAGLTVPSGGIATLPGRVTDSTRADSWRDTVTERLLDGAGPPRRPRGLRLPAGGRLIRTTRCWRSIAGAGEPPCLPGFDASFSTIPERHYRTVAELALRMKAQVSTHYFVELAVFRGLRAGAQLGAGPVHPVEGLLVFFSRWWQLGRSAAT